MANLYHHKGNLFELMWKVKDPERLAVVPHVCNDQGAWGAGFVLAISKIAPASLGPARSPEAAYKLWHAYQTETHVIKKQNIEWQNNGAIIYNPFELGSIQVCTVGLEKEMGLEEFDKYFEVVNMVAQHKFGREKKRYLRYSALVECMSNIANALVNREDVRSYKSEIHCVKFGSDRAGGKWEFIEELIQEIWVDRDINVHVYSL